MTYPQLNLEKNSNEGQEREREGRSNKRGRYEGKEESIVNKNLLKTIENMKAKMKTNDREEINKLMVAQTDSLTEDRRNVQVLRERQKNWRSMQKLSPMRQDLPQKAANTCQRGELSFVGSLQQK
jgi:hypothetical protein